METADAVGVDGSERVVVGTADEDTVDVNESVDEGTADDDTVTVRESVSVVTGVKVRVRVAAGVDDEHAETDSDDDAQRETVFVTEKVGDAVVDTVFDEDFDAVAVHDGCQTVPSDGHAPHVHRMGAPEHGGQ